MTHGTNPAPRLSPPMSLAGRLRAVLRFLFGDTREEPAGAVATWCGPSPLERHAHTVNRPTGTGKRLTIADICASTNAVKAAADRSVVEMDLHAHAVANVMQGTSSDHSAKAH
jgi:hypothetical protein